MGNGVHPGLRFLKPQQAALMGGGCDDMLVCDPREIVGRLLGFIVDPVARQLKYLVVQTAGLLSRKQMVPVTAARVDLRSRAIHLLDPDAAAQAEPFTPERYPEL